jgi:hypothetical protein
MVGMEYSFIDYAAPVLLLVSLTVLTLQKKMFYLICCLLLGMCINTLLGCFIKCMTMPHHCAAIGSKEFFKSSSCIQVQQLAFLFAYMTCIFDNITIFVVYIMSLLLNTAILLYVKKCDAWRLVLGGSVGFIVGRATYFICSKQIQGVIQEKSDDDAPI